MSLLVPARIACLRTGLALGLLFAVAPVAVRADEAPGAGDAPIVTPAPASDDEALAQAKQHFQAGRDAFDARDYQNALREFRTAQQLKPSPLLEYNIGLCFEALGRKKKAVQSYQSFLQQRPDADNRAEVEARIAGLERSLGSAPGPQPELQVQPEQPPVQQEQQGTLQLEPPKRSYKYQRRWGLFAAGAALFGGMYLITVAGAAVDNGNGGSSAELYIPLVGPIVYAAAYNANATCDPTTVFGCSDTQAKQVGVTTVMVIDFLAQAAGVAMALGGALTKRKVPVWAMPQVTQRFAGLAVGGTF